MIAYTQNPTPRNQRNQISELKSRCNQRGILVATHNPTPAEIIPLVERRLAEHQNHFARTMDPFSGYYTEWKGINDDLTKFLTELRAAAGLSATINDNSPSNPSNPSNPSDPSEPSNANEPAPIPREKIKQHIENHIANLPTSIHQQLKPVPPPSDQASDPRPTPVYGPSADASDASTDAPSADAPKPTSAAPGPQTREEYLSQLLREATSQSPIDDFPPERQSALYELILEHPYTVVVKMIAQPEPLGWNFHTSDTSLKRFKKRYEKKLNAAEQSAAYAEACRFLVETAHDEQHYTDAARRLLKIRLYKNAADPKASAEELELIMKLLDRQRRTDLAERRVKVAEKKADK